MIGARQQEPHARSERGLFNGGRMLGYDPDPNHKARLVVNEDEARRALEGLQLLGRELDDELQALATSRITAEEGGTP